MKKYTFELRQFFDKDSSTYTYLIFDSETKEGLIIDPVRENFSQNLKHIEELGIILKFIIDTHLHADHVTSSSILKKSTGAKIVFGKFSEVECADILIEDGTELNFGKFCLRAISTPGHTNSCMSFFTEGRLFTGDTLLIRSCGRTDFQKGDSVKLYESITKKLYLFPDNTIVYPGHDYLGRTISTIGEEKKFNLRISKKQSLSKFVSIMKGLNLSKPDKMGRNVRLNIQCGNSKDE